MSKRFVRLALASTASLFVASSVLAGPSCADVEAFLAGKATGVVCFPSNDLRTNNGQTTPPDNSITTYADGTPLPGPTVLGSQRSFTPTLDRTVISNGPAPSGDPVPGIQVQGWFAQDSTGQARFVLRFPDDWNGKLVVAGAAGNRSEYNGDWAWSDYVLPKGYAYASQNKGAYNFYWASLTSPTPPADDPLACRLNPNVTFWLHWYVNDPGKSFGEWTAYMLATAKLAQGALKATYQRAPRRTYAVGTSNGGYQVRRAVEEAPDLFDGGVDWEGTFIDAEGPNLLIDLPPAIKHFPDYVASGYNPNSEAALAIKAAGYPPDIGTPATPGGGTLWQRNYDTYWEVTMCQWQKRLDPTYDTYASGLGDYDYLSRIDEPGVFDALVDIENTGKIKKPLVTVAGTMDTLLPITRHARAYEAKVDASRKGNNEHRSAPYRLYEVQNGNHIESYVGTLTQLVPIQPHAHKAFDLLVAHVEQKAPLPPSQCVPKGGMIAATPTEPGHCASLLVP